METQKKNTTNIEFGKPMTFFDGLLLLFIGLKLTGHIDWSWWWVFSPIWGIMIFAVIVGVKRGIKHAKERY